jgi:hypothetical protein
MNAPGWKELNATIQSRPVKASMLKVELTWIR